MARLTFSLYKEKSRSRRLVISPAADGRARGGPALYFQGLPSKRAGLREACGGPGGGEGAASVHGEVGMSFGVISQGLAPRSRAVKGRASPLQNCVPAGGSEHDGGGKLIPQPPSDDPQACSSGTAATPRASVLHACLLDPSILLYKYQLWYFGLAAVVARAMAGLTWGS